MWLKWQNTCLTSHKALNSNPKKKKQKEYFKKDHVAWADSW
jgi:hypothetical protein